MGDAIHKTYDAGGKLINTQVCMQASDIAVMKLSMKVMQEDVAEIKGFSKANHDTLNGNGNNKPGMKTIQERHSTQISFLKGALILLLPACIAAIVAVGIAVAGNMWKMRSELSEIKGALQQNEKITHRRTQ